jgi:hypothetical protein
VGTDIVQVRIDFDSYRQVFNNATHEALLAHPEVPGVYRTRQNFAPSLSLIPVPDVKLSFGTSFQRFETQYPVSHTQTAYAGTATLQFRRQVVGLNGYRQDIRASYGLRAAGRTLQSDFVYTRHFLTADYTLRRGRNLFGAHIQAGRLTGTAPLFERFALGNSATLRGWNKFDVAPLGGSRMLHGSLEYRYRPFQIFYDAGVVHDPAEPAKVRHGLGFGYASRDGIFVSLAFPIRLHNVVPMFMFGFRN